MSLAFTDDWIIRWFGSYLQPASITWLSYAKTLMRVPLGVVGQGVGVASFPFLAQLYSEGKFDELNRLLNSTLKGLIAVLVPISALTIAESAPVVYLVFSHTRMRPPDLDATAATLVFFIAGHVCLGRAVHPGPRLLRHAQHAGSRHCRHGIDFRQPADVLAARPPLCSIWDWRMASSIGITVYTVILFFLLNRRTHNRESKAPWPCFSSRFAPLPPWSAWPATSCAWPSSRTSPGTVSPARSLFVIVTAAGILLLLLVGSCCESANSTSRSSASGC